MRLAVVLALLASLLVALPVAPADAARKKKPVSCAAKAKKIKSAKKRRAALRKCKKKKAKRPVANQPAPAAPAPAPAAPRAEGGVDDVTVVAVIDMGLNPFHWDFLASRMPQHRDADPGNDLPLDRPATEWLPGFGGDLKSFTRIDLDLEQAKAKAPFGNPASLQTLKPSHEQFRHGYWLPGTKVIGAMAYGEVYEGPQELWHGADAHGVGSASSAVGNLHGTCPECLLFFIDAQKVPQAEAALEWAMAQPWIDVISNSYGTRTQIYAGSDIARHRAAAERGQEIVFSAGNGVANAPGYLVPNPTTYSSWTGPDWILTVGAAAPGQNNHYGMDADGGAYSGAGKPVDVAGIGQAYPNAWDAETVSGVGSWGFSGTSNAAPTVAGLYARALHLTRTALRGPSKVQEGGVIATGEPIACGPARPDCELGDGRLTEVELRTRLLHGAVHSEGGTALLGQAENPTLPPVDEADLMGEGHGTYFARQEGPRATTWLTELERIVGPMVGRAPALERPAGEREWFVVDSYCRQKAWGAWSSGFFVEGATELPGPDPAWPVRSANEQTCLGGPTPLG